MSIKEIMLWTTTLAALIALYSCLDSLAIFLASIVPLAFTIGHLRGIRRCFGRFGLLAITALAAIPLYFASIGPFWFISTRHAFAESVPSLENVVSDYFYAPLHFCINHCITESQSEYLTNDYLADWNHYGYWYFDIYGKLEERLTSDHSPL